MKLLKVELINFKSFYGKSLLQVSSSGITSFIGPNGCGKSNIIDALRWVLGEQSPKALRGGAMPDVIFAGSTQHEPANYCEVKLTFENTNFENNKVQELAVSSVNTDPSTETPKVTHNLAQLEQVKISRQLDRQGNSGYYINDKICRLSDIRDIFLDAGIGGAKSYAIVEQGSVGQLLTAKASDRRVLIEEAAGIVKFNAKKNEAQKKLLASEQNQLRISDILTELEAQESVLSQQAAKAKDYLHKKNRVDRIESMVMGKQWYDCDLQLVKLKTELADKEQLHQESLNDFQILDNQVAALKIDNTYLEKKLSDLEKRLQDKKNMYVDLNTEQKLLQQKITNLGEWQKIGQDSDQEIQFNQKKLLQKKEEASVLKQDFIDKKHRLLEELDIEQMKFDKLAAKKKELSADLTSKNSQFIDLSNFLARIDTQIANLQNQINNHEQENFDQQNWQAEQQKIMAEIADHQQSIDPLDIEINTSQLKLKESIQKNQQVKEDLQSAKRQLSQVRKQIADSNLHLAKLQALIDAWEKTHHRNKKAFTALYAENTEQQSNFLGCISDYITIQAQPPLAWIKSIEQYLNIAIFKSSFDQQAISSLLAENDADNFAFIFVDNLPAVSTNIQDIPCPFFSFVNKPIPEKLRAWISQLLSTGDTSLDVKQQCIIKKLSGLYVYFDKDKVSSLKQHQDHLWQSRQFLDQQNEYSQQEQQLLYQIKQLYREEQQTANELAALHKKQQNLIHAQELKKETISQLQSQLAQYQKNIQHQEQQQQKKISANKADLQKLAQLQESQIEKQEAFNTLKLDLEHQNQASNDVQLAIDKEQHKLQEFRLNVINVENNIDKQQQLLDSYQGQLQALEAKKDKIVKDKMKFDSDYLQDQNKLTKLAKDILDLEKNIAELTAETEHQKQSFDKSRLDLAQSSEQLAPKYARLKQLSSDIEILNYKLQSKQLDQQKIEDELFESKKLKPQEVIRTFDVNNMDLAQQMLELKNLKISLAKIDDVNFAAEAEHKEVSQRLNFLQSQYQDLSDSIALLRKTISEIDRISKKMFQETFEAVNQHFSKLFPILFGGGNAHIELTHPDDILNSGLEIFAQPPGKRTQNLNLLSGGEKALVSIALVFAIFLYRPSPFCLLDEIDAPLDVVNVHRFGNLLKSLQSNTQFVIITHNPNTMEISDYIYGVTMEDPGVSKIVSVDMRNYRQKKEFITNTG